MRRLTIILLWNLPFIISAQPLKTRYEQSGGRQTPTYSEIIAWWKQLDTESGQVKMFTMGPTDAGYPLHLAMISNDRDFDPASIRKKNKRIILINNGIHPGEPDGIDASMLLARDIVMKQMRLPDNVILAVIPVYNIGGCLNRSSHYRVNQNGPEEFGFRGNSQNLDLNRDFIKSDSKEARSFAQIFHFCDPDVFIDNHVSNGADYQHVMTLIASQHNKLGGAMGEFMNKKFEPGIKLAMKEKGFDIIPYVNVFNDTPENGWPEFLEGPRYSSGYATLWHSFAFVPETHMLKPYSQRVVSTYNLLQCFIEFTARNSEIIKQLREERKLSVKFQSAFALNWILDESKYSEITFKGYEAGQKQSEVSGLPRLYYDRTKPFEKKVRFYNTYQPNLTVTKPAGYIIPKGWWKVVELLKINKVQMISLPADTIVEVEAYRIEDVKPLPNAVENHHINTQVQINTSVIKIKFQKGDHYIPMNQSANRFLIEVLEPHGPDSYFAWNFFDGILSQKEGFSHYAFEETAAKLLRDDPALKKKLEEKKIQDSSFSKSAVAQLNFIYQNSSYFEPAYMRYPVFRVTQ